MYDHRSDTSRREVRVVCVCSQGPQSSNRTGKGSDDEVSNIKSQKRRKVKEEEEEDQDKSIIFF